MRIGNQTAYTALTLLEPFEFAIRSGFKAFEWFPDRKGTRGWSCSDVDKDTRRYIKEKAKAHDISLSVHMPLWANPLENDSMGSIIETLEFASHIGAVLINIHLYTEKGLDAYLEAILPIIRIASDMGIKVAVENTPTTPPGAFNRLFELIRRREQINHVGMCLDVGHANICEETRNDYIRFIDTISSDIPIIHVHLHENYGDTDSHLPLFTGPSKENDLGIRELIKRLKHRGFRGAIIFEQWPDPPSILKEAQERLLSIIESVNTTPCNGDLVKLFIDIEHNAKSWREKLNSIYNILREYKDTDFIDELLIYTAIYLRFLGTGEIQCSEDGRHFRPNHLARVSKQIQELLLEMSSGERLFIIRKIYPWLPSYDGSFMKAEPLTRIRDIAHRNDIPKELKKEIKHTLQNKLHRCAGPEDLLTSENILKRITSEPDKYSPSFIKEFKLFHRELKEFFNALSLEERLLKIGEQRGALKGIIDEFIEAKKSGDDNIVKQYRLIELSTRLRESLINDSAMRSSESLAQDMRLADIAIEEYIFVLLSRMFNELNSLEHIPWKEVLKTIALSVHNLGLSGIEQSECIAVESELNRWSEDISSVDWLLLVKATLERCQRITQHYSDSILKLFSDKAERLGKELGVADYAVRVFCEGDIGGSLVFQISKLLSLLLKRIRVEAHLPPWDVVVPGRASGKLIFLNSLRELHSEDSSLIVIVERAEGDEEIPGIVKGIILLHELPHLCHLGVRARQDGVVFVISEQEEEVKELMKHEGEYVFIEASSSGFSISKRDEDVEDNRNIKNREIYIPPVKTTNRRLLELGDIDSSIGGAKAEGVRRLRSMSMHYGFKTPDAVVIPFGVMEDCIKQSSEHERYWELVKSIDLLDGEELLRAIEELSSIVMELPIDEDTIRSIKKRFREEDRLMVRSSSNCEDLGELSGAGLYDSVANVGFSELKSAINRVWASLWSRRAVLSRRQYGIPQERASMAVLIQKMVVPDYAFIVHTVNPINNREDELYIELVPGLGEPLASASLPGVPYRMICNKKDYTVKMLSFCNFSSAITLNKDGLIEKTIDYTEIPFSFDKNLRQHIGRLIPGISVILEDEFKCPQDIEGGVLNGEIYIFQCRPQHVIKKE